MKYLFFDTETTGLPKKTFDSYGKKTTQWPHIVQLCWIILDDYDFSMQSHNHIIKIPYNVSVDPISESIHHISHDIIRKHGEDPITIFTKLKEDMLHVDCIIAHNLNFDKSIFIAECKRYNIPNPFYDIDYDKQVCTMKLGIPLCKLEFPPRPNYSNTFSQKVTFNTNSNINILTNTSRTHKKTIKYKYPKLIELHHHLFPEDKYNLNDDLLHNALYDVLLCIRCFFKIQHNIDIKNITKRFRASRQDEIGIINNTKKYDISGVYDTLYK